MNYISLTFKYIPFKVTYDSGNPVFGVIEVRVGIKLDQGQGHAVLI